jgi:integrase
LRLLEALRLRVQDVDFGMKQLTVRDGKGAKDRFTMLPEKVMPTLQEHLERVRRLREEDLAGGGGSVYLPGAVERKYPHSAREWQYEPGIEIWTLSNDLAHSRRRESSATEVPGWQWDALKPW